MAYAFMLSCLANRCRFVVVALRLFATADSGSVATLFTKFFFGHLDRYCFAAMFSPVIVLIIVLAKVRLHAAVVIFCMVIFWTIIIYHDFLRPIASLEVYYLMLVLSARAGSSVFLRAELIAGNAMIFVLLLILLSVAPAKVISRRLIFLALGLLLLIALNELSKLGVDLTAPKLQG